MIEVDFIKLLVIVSYIIIGSVLGILLIPRHDWF